MGERKSVELTEPLCVSSISLVPWIINHNERPSEYVSIPHYIILGHQNHFTSGSSIYPSSKPVAQTLYPLRGMRVSRHGGQMSCLDSHSKFRKRWRGQLSRCPAPGSLVDTQLPAVLWRQAPGHPETHGQAAGGRAGSWLEELAAGTSWIGALGHSQGCLVGVQGEGSDFIQPALRRAPGQVPAICQS